MREIDFPKPVLQWWEREKIQQESHILDFKGVEQQICLARFHPPITPVSFVGTRMRLEKEGGIGVITFWPGHHFFFDSIAEEASFLNHRIGFQFPLQKVGEVAFRDVTNRHKPSIIAKVLVEDIQE